MMSSNAPGGTLRVPPTVAEAAELRAPELLLAVDRATNTDALRALRDKENLRARPRKTVLRAITARLEYLEDWLEIPGLWSRVGPVRTEA